MPVNWHKILDRWQKLSRLCRTELPSTFQFPQCKRCGYCLEKPHTMGKRKVQLTKTLWLLKGFNSELSLLLKGSFLALKCVTYKIPSLWILPSRTFPKDWPSLAVLGHPGQDELRPKGFTTLHLTRCLGGRSDLEDFPGEKGGSQAMRDFLKIPLWDVNCTCRR